MKFYVEERTYYTGNRRLYMVVEAASAEEAIDAFIRERPLADKPDPNLSFRRVLALPRAASRAIFYAGKVDAIIAAWVQE